MTITEKGSALKEKAMPVLAQLSACIQMEPEKALLLYELLYELLGKLTG